MNPAIIAALIGAATSAIQGISGASQRRKANELESQYPRPEATMSPYVQKQMDYAYGKTFDQDVPGGERYRNEVKGVGAAGMRAASELGSGSEAFGFLGQVVGGEQKGFADQGRAIAERVAGAEQNYMGSLEGGNQEWQRMDYWNKQMPYLQAAEAARALRETGGQNMMSGVKNMAGMATALLGGGTSSTSGDSPFTDEQLQLKIEEIIKAGVTTP